MYISHDNRRTDLLDLDTMLLEYIPHLYELKHSDIAEERR